MSIPPRFDKEDANTKYKLKKKLQSPKASFNMFAKVWR